MSESEFWASTLRQVVVLAQKHIEFQTVDEIKGAGTGVISGGSKKDAVKAFASW